MKQKGRIFVFGDNVNTDEIIPARYLNTIDPVELAGYCMEDSRPGFGKREDLKGSIMVAGENFGCGSSREHAPIAIQASGIGCVVARSFARIFLRNSINIGLPLVTIPDLDTSVLSEGDELMVDFEAGLMEHVSLAEPRKFQPYPEFLRSIIRHGGWLNYARRELLKEDVADEAPEKENLMNWMY